MVCTYAYALFLSIGIVVDEITVTDGGALGRLDVAEAYGVVDSSTDALVALGAKVGNSNAFPVNLVVLFLYIVLVTRDVNSVYTVTGIGEPLTQIAVVFPFAHTQIAHVVDAETESVAHILLP